MKSATPRPWATVVPTMALGATLVVGALAAACSSEDSSSQKPLPTFPRNAATGLRVASHGPVPSLPEWPDNPPSEAKSKLGNLLFNDVRLSGSGRQSCTGCHLGTGFFQSSTPLDVPDRSYPNLQPTLPRHTPSLLNLVYAPMARWDGSFFTDVFDVCVLPFAEANMNVAATLPADKVDEIDLDDSKVALTRKLTVDYPGYVAKFQEAFGIDIKSASVDDVWRSVGKAIAVYLRAAVSRDSAFDRWNVGDDTAMGESAIRGLALFEGEGRCSVCHSGPFFSDFQFHNVNTALPRPDGTRSDEGRYLVTKDDRHRGAFLTPSLRSAAKTSPYFHDGSEISIAGVLRQKRSKALRDPARDPVVDMIPNLSDRDIDDLVAFIKTLTGAPVPEAEIGVPKEFP